MPLPLSDRMLRDFMEVALEQGSIYTVPVETGGELCLHVLRVNKQAAKLVKTTRAVPLPQFTVTIQKYEVWRSSDSSRTIYPFGNPERVDPVRLSSVGSFVNGLRVWTKNVSDVESCLDICDARIIKNQLSLESESCPVILLLSRLMQLGWRRSETVIKHNSGGRTFSSINAPAKRFYFQCVLRIDAVLALGMESMPSDQPQSFYRCLLKGHLAPPRIGDKAYLQILSGAPAPALPPAPEGLPIDDDSDTVLDVPYQECLPDHVAGVLQDAPHAPAADIVPDSSSDSEILEAFQVSACIHDLPATIDGASVRFENYHNMYERYLLTCTYHTHCVKSRNCGFAQTKHFGAWEPLAYLAVWHAKGPSVLAENHVDVRVSLDEVRAWLESNNKL
jgi:hypothetical protein